MTDRADNVLTDEDIAAIIAPEIEFLQAEEDQRLINEALEEVYAEMEELGRPLTDVEVGDVLVDVGAIPKVYAKPIAKARNKPVYSPRAKTAPDAVHGAYRRQYFKLEEGEPETFAEFFEAIRLEIDRRIASGVPPDYIAGIDIAYKLPQEQFVWRHQRAETVRAMEFEALAREFDILDRVPGSEQLPENAPLDLGQFYINWWHPLGGAGRKHDYTPFETKYYKCREPKQTGATSQCLINIMRSASPGKVGKKSATLMKERGLQPDDELPPAAMEWLEELFGCSLPIWDGDEIEIVRVFRDSPKKGNACISRAKPVVIRPANIEYPLSDAGLAIVLSKGHYSIATECKPIELHPVTGDEVTGNETDESVAARLIEQRRTLHGSLKKALKTAYKHRVLCYDLETVFDRRTGELYPYACAWFIFDPEKPPTDFGACEKEVSVKITKYPGDREDNPLIALLDAIELVDDDIKLTLEAYNGAAFDHLFLARGAAERDKFSSLSWFASKVYAGSIGRHKFHDLCRFTTASLDSVCEEFDTKPKKVKGFKHSIPQTEYFRGEAAWDKWLTTNAIDLHRYIKNDVLALADVTVKARKAFEKLGVGDILEFPTIGSMAWSAWTKGLSPDEVPGVPTSREMDQFMRSALTAGRVELVRNDGKPQIVEGNLRMYDFKSLYPTVCLGKGYGDEVFPTSDIIATDKPVAGKLGIYRCRVMKQPGINIVPKRGETLNWKEKGIFDAILTSVDINEIRRFGGRVGVGGGYYWEKSSKTLFEKYFKGPAEEKQRQDALPKKVRNQALRECSKLLMNCLTGKVAQRERLEVCKVVKGAKAQLRFREKHTDIEVVPLYGDSIIMSGIPVGRPWNQRNAKPCYIACFIYSYARRCLYDMLPYSHYCDTDSSLMTEQDAARFVKDHPERLPAVGEKAGFGHVAEELTDKGTADNYVAYLAQPKTYAIFAKNRDGTYAEFKNKDGELERACKVKCKGVKGSDIVLKASEAANIQIADDQPINRFIYYEAFTDGGRKFKKEENAERLMKSLVVDGSANVLCSQLTRSLSKNEGAFVVTQRYLVKNLSIAAKEEPDDCAAPATAAAEAEGDFDYDTPLDIGRPAAK